MHVETDYLLTASARALVATLLHEGWHAHGGYSDHPGVDKPPYPAPYHKAASCVGLS